MAQRFCTRQKTKKEAKKIEAKCVRKKVLITNIKYLLKLFIYVWETKKYVKINKKKYGNFLLLKSLFFHTWTSFFVDDEDGDVVDRCGKSLEDSRPTNYPCNSIFPREYINFWSTWKQRSYKLLFLLLHKWNCNFFQFVCEENYN